ncbi:CNDP dipeptidase [Cylindrobasidium torrendii FP15055 ss-10]|uniref:CNDP dipeptidase n=1 Tax=Cylindrobasidium torrendii FP15055 ss-10 TaxID=1314674 RepID=A0A0D7BGE8_9AGAR|nr:CNDP dipeptidase [Cylindrobasidium torrendii FP15055 ss-10]
MSTPREFLKFIDDNAENFIKRLADAVAIQSVSSDLSRRDDVIKMAHWVDAQLKSYGVTTELRDLGSHTVDGVELPLPPAVLGRIGNDSSKRTVLIYGHFDVQPAEKSDGWNTEPFILTEGPDGQLFGRGSTDDKGPILGWLNVLQYHFENKKELPVNVRFCFEGMEESGSEGLDDLVIKEAKQGGWFDGVDCVCISDNYWLNTRTPVVTYGLRGIAYYRINVSGPGWDLHSGVFGRTVHEPMTDLVLLLSKLVDVKGNILIPGIDAMVAAADEDERAIYERLDSSVAEIEAAAGGKIALVDNKVDLLMGRMRSPSLSLHGIEGAFSGSGGKTVIPAKINGKFSLRLVPPQTPENVTPLVTKYINEEIAKLGSKNTISVEYLNGGLPWMADIKHWNYEAAREATRQIYQVEPDMTREGGSIPVTLTFADALACSVVLLPMGRGDDGAHSTNEKLDRSNFLQGSKLLGTYLYELASAK